MAQQSFSLHQVSIALLNAALSLEYFMNDEFSIYEDEKTSTLVWTNSLGHLLEWSTEQAFELGVPIHELETWGDALILEDFKPIAKELSEKNQTRGGKLAFLVLTLSYVLKVYLSLPNALGTEQIVLLLSQLKVYLREKWQTDLDSGIINQELNSFHVPMASDFAQRWQNRLELLVNEAS
jgi:hypothetical protein